MKNYEFWCTKKCPGKEFISKFIYEIMENHEFIYEFIKKKKDLGCTKKCSVKDFLYMKSYEVIFTHVNSYMNSCMKTFL